MSYSCIGLYCIWYKFGTASSRLLDIIESVVDCISIVSTALISSWGKMKITCDSVFSNIDKRIKCYKCIQAIDFEPFECNLGYNWW